MTDPEDMQNAVEELDSEVERLRDDLTLSKQATDRHCKELADAIKYSLSRDGLCLIEVIIDRDDCSKELLEWGSRVSSNNGRPPRVL